MYAHEDAPQDIRYIGLQKKTLRCNKTALCSYIKIAKEISKKTLRFTYMYIIYVYKQHNLSLQGSA